MIDLNKEMMKNIINELGVKNADITINEKRDAVKSAVVIEVKDGQFVFKERISP